jgi:hypothetical protein
MLDVLIAMGLGGLKIIAKKFVRSCLFQRDFSQQ